jgi:hypothetical protein
VDGSILREKALKIFATLGIENFSTLNGWISHFKKCHILVLRNWPGRDTNATDLWFKRLS